MMQSAKSVSACRCEFGERCHGEHRRIGRHLGFEVGADTGKRSVHVDRRHVARAFVHHVRGDGRETFVPLEICGRTARQHEDERDDRQRPVLG